MASSGNFATWNGVEIPAYLSLSQGNTKVLGNTSTDASGMNLNTGVNSGKWYIEFYVILTTSSYPYIGLSAGASSQDFSANNTGYNGDIRYHVPNSTGMENNTGTSGIINRWGTISTTETGVDACSSGDIVGFALDMDNKKLFISRNGTFFNSGDPANGTNPQATWTTNPESAFINCFTYTSSRGCVVNAGQDSSFSNNKTSGSANATDANGFGNFYYTPPSSGDTKFLALCSANLPVSDDIDPAQTDNDYPSKQFGVLTWTGTGSSNALTGLGFAPDLCWIKKRNSSQSHVLMDSTRGTSKALESNTNSQEDTSFTQGVTAFGTDGFTVGTHTQVNNSSDTYVGWCWRANGGTTTSDSSGDITVSRQTNNASKFSILTYTGNGSSGSTIAHGLGVKPAMTIIKQRNSSNNWNVWHQGYNNGDYDSFGELNSSGAWNANQGSNGPFTTDPTTSLLTLTAYGQVNGNSNTYVCYAWSDVVGMQKFGTYVGNGNNGNGPFIYTGFRPRLLFVKDVDAGNEWYVQDTARETHNPTEKFLEWDTSDAEQSKKLDIYSNGFKPREDSGRFNDSHTYVYGAWSDVPFRYNNTF